MDRRHEDAFHEVFLPLLDRRDRDAEDACIRLARDRNHQAYAYHHAYMVPSFLGKADGPSWDVREVGEAHRDEVRRAVASLPSGDFLYSLERRH